MLLSSLLLWIFFLELAVDCKESGSRILNQLPIETNFTVKFPYHVNFYWELDLSDKAFCGGVLVSEKWVLTSAHCLIDKNCVLKADVHNDRPLAAAGVFFRDVSVDHTRQTSLVVKVVPHPEFCRDEGGSIKTLVESFDFATCKLSHALTITQWVAPLQLIHAVKVLQGSYKAYLKKQYIYVVGMGMCNRTVQYAALQRGAARLSIAEKQDLQFRRNISFFPYKFLSHPYKGDSGSGISIVKDDGSNVVYSLLAILKQGVEDGDIICRIWGADVRREGTIFGLAVKQVYRWIEGVAGIKFRVQRPGGYAGSHGTRIESCLPMLMPLLLFVCHHIIS